jgi:hypothetical protein
MERSDFDKMESLPESSEGHLFRLARYFAVRAEHFRSLEDLYKDMDPTNVIADDGRGFGDRVS